MFLYFFKKQLDLLVFLDKEVKKFKVDGVELYNYVNQYRFMGWVGLECWGLGIINIKKLLFMVFMFFL